MPLVSSETGYILPESGSKCLVANLSSPLGVIVTHPWGLLGGNMHNNVVKGIVRWFQQLNITTMRFDFVGTQIGRGTTQVNQVIEASNFLLRGCCCGTQNEDDDDDDDNNKIVVPPKYILLVGYSYGSIISGSASVSIPRCIGLICIAPPFAVRHWLYLFNGNYHLQQLGKRKDLPKLFVIGSNDNFTSEEIFMNIVNDTMPQHTTTTTTGAVLKNADHFFRGREKDLMDIIGKKDEKRKRKENECVCVCVAMDGWMERQHHGNHLTYVCCYL